MVKPACPDTQPLIPTVTPASSNHFITVAGAIAMAASCFIAGSAFNSGSSASNPAVPATSTPLGLSGTARNARADFEAANALLIGPARTDGKSDGECLPGCGCAHPPNVGDCPRQYDLDAVRQSSDLADALSVELFPVMALKVQELHDRAREACEGKGEETIQTRGGWCLDGCPKEKGRFDCEGNIEHQGKKWSIPYWHKLAPQHVVKTLVDMIQSEGIKSFTEFGAGVGQYETAVLKELPDFAWNSFDGAGNVVEWTKGTVNYVDLTVPLALPKTDWVMSVEVMEHIPSRYEGMFVRNLHHHNCKGVILSCSALTQGGHGHINNHSNEYVIELMKELGYTHDTTLSEELRKDVPGNWPWLTKTLMVFRRSKPVC